MLTFRFIAVLSFALLGVWACGSVNKHTEPIIAKAEIRYLADKKDLQVDLQLFRGDSFSVSRPFTPPPGSVAFLGSGMEQRKISGKNRWRTSRQLDLPDELRFTFPKDSLSVTDKATVNFNILPITADSIPDLMSKSAKRTNFSIGAHPLGKGESLIVFFEPDDRSARPRRIVIAGPTNTPTVSIPIAALTDVPFGKYDTYLVKQGIIKSESPELISAITYQYHSASRPVFVAE